MCFVVLESEFWFVVFEGYLFFFDGLFVVKLKLIVKYIRWCGFV